MSSEPAYLALCRVCGYESEDLPWGMADGSVLSNCARAAAWSGATTTLLPTPLWSIERGGSVPGRPGGRASWSLMDCRFRRASRG